MIGALAGEWIAIRGLGPRRADRANRPHTSTKLMAGGGHDGP